MAYKLQKVLHVPWVLHLSDPWTISPIYQLGEAQEWNDEMEMECFKCATILSFSSLETIQIYGEKCKNCISDNASKDSLIIQNQIKIKEQENLDFKISNLEEKISKTYPNHILHFLLSLFTGGIWIIIWIFVTVSSNFERKSLTERLKETYKEKEEFDSLKKQQEELEIKYRLYRKLSKLSELLDKGHITQEEFEAQKVKLLQ